MDLMKALVPDDPATKERKTSEKRRRLSYLKAKHQDQFQPSEPRGPKPKPIRPSTTQVLRKGTKKVVKALQEQAKKVPSDRDLENFVWRDSGKKKS